MLSYFPGLRNATDGDGFQFIRLPNFNISDHIRNMIAGPRGGSNNTYYPGGMSKQRQTPYVPQPPTQGCPVNNLPPEVRRMPLFMCTI
jgi:hypothetical protein